MSLRGNGCPPRAPRKRMFAWVEPSGHDAFFFSTLNFYLLQYLQLIFSVIQYPLTQVTVLGRLNPCLTYASKWTKISNQWGWRAVNILNKPAISYVNSLEPPTVMLCGGVFCLINAFFLC